MMAMKDLKNLLTKARNFDKYAYIVRTKDGFIGAVTRRTNMEKGKSWFEGWVVHFYVEKKGLILTLQKYLKINGKYELKVCDLKEFDGHEKIDKDVIDFIEGLFNGRAVLKVYLIEEMAILVYFFSGLIQAVYFFNYKE